MELKEMRKVGVEVYNETERDELTSLKQSAGWKTYVPGSHTVYPFALPAYSDASWASSPYQRAGWEIITLQQFKERQGIMKYSEGDVLVNSNNTLEIQGNIGKVYVSVDAGGTTRMDTEKALDEYGYTLKTDEPELVEKTVAEVEKEMGLPAGTLRIKK